MDTIIILVIIAIFIMILMYFQDKIRLKEDFRYEIPSNKLLIKKTMNYDKVFENSKYSIWIPTPINDYYPIGNYISFNKKPPTQMATLVKNNSGLESNDKPIKYEIVSITNKNYAIWKPIGETDQLSLGHIYSKEYPSKYLIRTLPSKFCEKSIVNNRLIKNKISNFDKGYELWSIQNSSLFICNNINNYNLNALKDVYSLKENSLDTEKKLYIKSINSYKKICNYKDEKLGKKFYVWRPVPPPNFCSLGDIILSINNDPNGKLNTIVVNKSFCKIPLNYGTKSINTIKSKSKNINFWRPKPHNDYYFFGDIVVVGDEQPEADNLIYSISVDYIKNINEESHTLVYNNISDENPISLWSDPNHCFKCSNSYSNPNKNNYILNMNFTESDYDLSDTRKTLHISYNKNNNFKKINEDKLIGLIKQSISNKLDIRLERLNNISLDTNNVILDIEPKSNHIKEPTINKCISKLNKHIEVEPLKIYNKNKDTHYISLMRVFNTEDNNFIELDNSHFNTLEE
jgi:hypothetical protein